MSKIDYSKPLPFFVYGTLKKGYGNHCVLLGKDYNSDKARLRPRFRGKATVAGRLFLRPNGIPEMYHGDGIVCGEVWEYPATQFEEACRRIDSLEGFSGRESGWNAYNREEIVARTVDAGCESHRIEIDVPCWAYFSPHEAPDGGIELRDGVYPFFAGYREVDDFVRARLDEARSSEVN